MTDNPAPRSTDAAPKIGDVLESLPGHRGRPLSIGEDVRSQLDDAKGKWVVLRVDLKESFSLSPYQKASREWDGTYNFATRTMGGTRVLLGQKETA